MAKWPFGRRLKEAPDRDILRTPESTTLAPLDEKKALVPDAPPKTSTVGRLSRRKLSRKSLKRDRLSDEKGKGKGKGDEEQHKEVLLNSKSDPAPDYSSDKEISAALDMTGAQPSATRRNDDPRGDVPSYYFEHNNESQKSITKTQAWDGLPTLRPKVNESNSLIKRKSTRRRKRDPSREAEIKHMSADIPPIPPIPKRPLTYSGGPLERDNRKMRDGLNRRLERPMSDVSLPLAGSIHSTLSLNSDTAPLRISSFGILSPKPTIRYSKNPRYSRDIMSSAGPSRHSSGRTKAPPDIPEETLKEAKRVEGLADDLNSGELRELMARDARRREKKRKSDREKAQRRLERRAAKQKTEETAAAAAGGKTSPVPSERGVMGRETLGLGIADSSKVEELPRPSSKSSSRKSKPRRSRSLKRKADVESDDVPATYPTDKADQGKGPTVYPVPPASPADVPHVRYDTHKTPSRLSDFSDDAPQLSSVDSHGPPHAASPTRHDTPDISEYGSYAPDSDADGKKAPYSWAGFFRRSLTGRSKHTSHRGSVDTTTASDFSTSRDSLPKPTLRPIPVYRTTRRTQTGPIRSTSLFTEDLPEFSSSRPGTKSTDGVRSIPSSAAGQDATLAEKISIAASGASHDVFTDAHETAETDTAQHTPTVAQSLASIDSEGSWLSGRPTAKRTSPLSGRLFEGGGETEGSISRTLEQDSDHDYEFTTPPSGLEAGTGLDGTSDVLSGTSTALDEQGSRTPRQETKTWHEAVARQPKVVRHGERIKSREGLLNDFLGDEEGQTPRAGDSGTGLQRATSVELGQKHARRISAGSARLLDVKRSSVGDSKGLALG
ncbi:MAG: hypothetical protein M1814_000216 [Vezdaea aestivalis]|nr:MAG: hypothetical protein M1814_000216 [Vezdaea aestivalis]